jgi:hypothetical protein
MVAQRALFLKNKTELVCSFKLLIELLLPSLPNFGMVSHHLFHFDLCLISHLIFSLSHWLFKVVLFNFHIYMNLSYFYVLINCQFHSIVWHLTRGEKKFLWLDSPIEIHLSCLGTGSKRSPTSRPHLLNVQLLSWWSKWRRETAGFDSSARFALFFKPRLVDFVE